MFSDVAELFISMIKDTLEAQITENYASFDPNTGSPQVSCFRNECALIGLPAARAASTEAPIHLNHHDYSLLIWETLVPSSVLFNVAEKHLTSALKHERNAVAGLYVLTLELSRLMLEKRGY